MPEASAYLFFASNSQVLAEAWGVSDLEKHGTKATGPCSWIMQNCMSSLYCRQIVAIWAWHRCTWGNLRAVPIFCEVFLRPVSMRFDNASGIELRKNEKPQNIFQKTWQLSVVSLGNFLALTELPLVQWTQWKTGCAGMQKLIWSGSMLFWNNIFLRVARRKFQKREVYVKLDYRPGWMSPHRFASEPSVSPVTVVRGGSGRVAKARPRFGCALVATSRTRTTLGSCLGISSPCTSFRAKYFNSSETRNVAFPEKGISETAWNLNFYRIFAREKESRIWNANNRNRQQANCVFNAKKKLRRRNNLGHGSDFRSRTHLETKFFDTKTN